MVTEAVTRQEPDKSDRPRLPQNLRQWLCIFGPGAIMASLTIGTGELIFSTRGGALFGYRILFLFALISLLKWGLVIATSRHMILTGVHPYERMIDLPGPRGWLPILLFLMAMVCLPIWISFHSGVLGNLTSWITGTSDLFHGGMDYVWGAAILILVLFLSITGGYTVFERVQIFVVSALVLCAGLSMILYNPNWLELIFGFVPQPLAYPDWLAEEYPDIARHSVWVETTRYVGVIGGAGFDYLAYTSWIREKQWGILPARATPQQLEEIAADPNHEVRKWINAPLVDCAISFALIVAFSAVFVSCGAMILGPEKKVPDEGSLLNLQSQFVTRIHSLLLPLYVTGAFLTMLGTLYGTIEIACSIADEIVQSFIPDWSRNRSRKLKRAVLAWCAPVALLILGWLFIRQATPEVPQAVAGDRQLVTHIDDVGETVRVQKPRLLLAILTPVNLFTGVLSCGLICILGIWMDRRELPPGLQPPKWLIGLNVFSAVVFIGLGIKGYWENEHRVVVVCSMVGIFVTAMIIAVVLGPRIKSHHMNREALASKNGP
jgi:glycerol uptake facilitator-like aquaporin